MRTSFHHRPEAQYPKIIRSYPAWGRLNVVTRFHHLSGDSHINRSLRAGPITASSQSRKLNLKS